MIDIENIKRSSTWINAEQSQLELKEIILELAKEVKALREVEDAARPLIRGLELAQEFGESTEKGWRRELKLQQALAGLDEARRG